MCSGYFPHAFHSQPSQKVLSTPIYSASLFSHLDPNPLNAGFTPTAPLKLFSPLSPNSYKYNGHQSSIWLSWPIPLKHFPSDFPDKTPLVFLSSGCSFIGSSWVPSSGHGVMLSRPDIPSCYFQSPPWPFHIYLTLSMSRLGCKNCMQLQLYYLLLNLCHLSDTICS